MSEEKLSHATAVNELRDRCYLQAARMGWHDEHRTHGDMIALMHSELSEALECFRDGHEPRFVWFRDKDGKPEGVPMELADTIIRILDYCGREQINIGLAIEKKLAFNNTRGERHGGKHL